MKKKLLTKSMVALTTVILGVTPVISLVNAQDYVVDTSIKTTQEFENEDGTTTYILIKGPNSAAVQTLNEHGAFVDNPDWAIQWQAEYEAVEENGGDNNTPVNNNGENDVLVGVELPGYTGHESAILNHISTGLLTQEEANAFIDELKLSTSENELFNVSSKANALAKEREVDKENEGELLTFKLSVVTEETVISTEFDAPNARVAELYFRNYVNENGLGDLDWEWSEENLTFTVTEKGKEVVPATPIEDVAFKPDELKEAAISAITGDIPKYNQEDYTLEAVVNGDGTEVIVTVTDKEGNFVVEFTYDVETKEYKSTRIPGMMLIPAINKAKLSQHAVDAVFAEKSEYDSTDYALDVEVNEDGTLVKVTVNDKEGNFVVEYEYKVEDKSLTVKAMRLTPLTPSTKVEVATKQDDEEAKKEPSRGVTPVSPNNDDKDLTQVLLPNTGENSNRIFVLLAAGLTLLGGIALVFRPKFIKK